MQELEKYSLDDTYIRPFDRDKQEIAIETENLRVFMVRMKPFIMSLYRLSGIRLRH